MPDFRVQLADADSRGATGGLQAPKNQQCREIGREAQSNIGDDVNRKGGEINRPPTKCVGQRAPYYRCNALDNEVRRDGQGDVIEADLKVLSCWSSAGIPLLKISCVP